MLRTESDLIFETPLEVLGRYWITPNDDFFVLSRQRIEVSEAEKSRWEIRVAGEVDRPLRLAITELRNSATFSRVQLDAYIQCAGYGRLFFEPPVEDVPSWGRGAIGNAVWEGVRLSDVLRQAGLRPSARHVAFAGRDSAQMDPPYIKSIPLEKAMEPHTLLAFRMNGVDIPVVHGGPLRLLVPGWAGTYSLKWLQGIEVLTRPWEGFWMSRAYQIPRFPIEPGSQTRTFQSVPITEITVNSMITKPLEKDLVPADRTAVVEGLAWSGRGEVDKVEVSTDGGRGWRLAKLDMPNDQFAWQRWRLPWEPTYGTHDIIARAHDASGAIQPLRQDNWNPDGYGWHVAPSVHVKVV